MKKVASIITEIRLPDGRVLRRIDKDVIAKALRAAGQKSAQLFRNQS